MGLSQEEQTKTDKTAIVENKQPVNFIKKNKTVLIIISIAVIAIIVAIISLNVQSGKTVNSNKVETVDVNTLVSEYIKNQVRADKEFKGKTVITGGTIYDIKQINGVPFFDLESDTANEYVQCTFRDQKEIDKLVKLNQGDKVVVKGTVGGKPGFVLLMNCEIED